MKRSLLAVLLLVAAIVPFAMGGCNVDQSDVDKARLAKTAANDLLLQFESDLAEARATLDTLPPGPERDRVVAFIAETEQRSASVREKLVVIDQVVNLAESGELDPGLIEAAKGVPSIGGYLAAALAIFAYARKRQKAGALEPYRKAFEEIRDGLRRVAPEYTDHAPAETSEVEREYLEFNAALSPDTQKMLKGEQKVK